MVNRNQVVIHPKRNNTVLLSSLLYGFCYCFLQIALYIRQYALTHSASPVFAHNKYELY